ncbi:hypothetical protein GF373_12035 [bacterium]|nr:hypothetical protein [bacterium]
MANVGVNQSWLFLLFLGLAGCVILGLRQVEFSLKGEGIWTRCVLLAVLGSLGMVSAFTTLPAQWSKALAYRQIRDTIQPAEARQVLARDEKPAVQFTPILYANLAQPCSYYPFLYKIGVRETGKAGAAAPKSYRFARVDNPPFIAIYNPAPDMDWLQSDAVQHGTFITTPYRRFYKRTIQPGIVFYERTLPKPFLQDWASVYASLDGPPLFQRTFMQTIGEYESFTSPPNSILPTPGVYWDFEGGYRNVRQEGIAFGVEPDFSDSAVGVGCAGPGAAGRESLMGTLESVPFSLQGDEFCFSAAIPNSVTANLFCLAVWQRQSWGPGREVTQTAPIFDRLKGEPLLADTFYYIKPEDLRYQEGWVQGWRVIHALHEAESADWQTYRWPLDGWRNQQAIWLCADRDRSSAIRIDHLFQSRRPPGYYWNFEDGTYQGWEISGTAFGDTPAMEHYGNQSPIRGCEGNYFVNSFYQGSDQAHGKLTSPVFPIPEGGLMVFRIGGGNDWDRTYLEFEVNGVAVKRATGNRSEILEPVVWDLRTWAGKPGRIRIVDESHDAWGHILIDDIRVYASPADT